MEMVEGIHSGKGVTIQNDVLNMLKMKIEKYDQVLNNNETDLQLLQQNIPQQTQQNQINQINQLNQLNQLNQFNQMNQLNQLNQQMPNQ